MAKVRFVLTLDQAGVPPTAVRLWLDRSGDDRLDPGEEVAMGTDDALHWIGTANVERVGGSLFLLKFIAPAGSKWDFEACSATDVHYHASGEMVAQKEHLVGRLA